MDECARGTLRSSESEGRCFGGLRRRNEGYHGRKPVEASFFSGKICGSLVSTELTVLGNPNIALRPSTFLFLFHSHCINLVQKKSFLT